VSKIQYDQKIMEKESLRKMSEIEGGSLEPTIIIITIILFSVISVYSYMYVVKFICCSRS